MDSAELIRLPRPFTKEVEALLLTVVCKAVTVEVLALPLRLVSRVVILVPWPLRPVSRVVILVPWPPVVDSNCAMATTFSSIVVLKRMIANFVSFRTCSGVSAGVGIRKIVLHDIDAAFPQSTSIVED